MPLRSWGGRGPRRRRGHVESRWMLPQQGTHTGACNPALPWLVRAPRMNVHSSILDNCQRWKQPQDTCIDRSRDHRSVVRPQDTTLHYRAWKRGKHPAPSSPIPHCVDGPRKHRERKQPQKATRHRIPFIRHVQNRQILGGRKQWTAGCGAGGGGLGGVSGCRGSAGSPVGRRKCPGTRE